MNSRAYSNWMINQSRIKTLIKFYPWAVSEVHDMWPQIGRCEEVFPDCTVLEALFNLDSTIEPILSFGIVQLASLFETYLGDRYAEIIEERISKEHGSELRINDEFKILNFSILSIIRLRIVSKGNWNVEDHTRVPSK